MLCRLPLSFDAANAVVSYPYYLGHTNHASVEITVNASMQTYTYTVMDSDANMAGGDANSLTMFTITMAASMQTYTYTVMDANSLTAVTFTITAQCGGSG